MTRLAHDSVSKYIINIWLNLILMGIYNDICENMETYEIKTNIKVFLLHVSLNSTLLEYNLTPSIDSYTPNIYILGKKDRITIQN